MRQVTLLLGFAALAGCNEGESSLVDAGLVDTVGPVDAPVDAFIATGESCAALAEEWEALVVDLDRSCGVDEDCTVAGGATWQCECYGFLPIHGVNLAAYLGSGASALAAQYHQACSSVCEYPNECWCDVPWPGRRCDAGVCQAFIPSCGCLTECGEADAGPG